MHGHSHSHGGGRLEEGTAEINHITNIGLVLNLVLSVVQVIVGAMVGSLALITDGIHTLSDMVTDVAVLIGVYFGSKKADAGHPWGHGRMETFAAGFVAMSLMAAGAIIIYEAVMAIVVRKAVEAHLAVLIIAMVCVLSKEWLYWATVRIAKKTNSTATYAKAWHHRSDAFSSIAVVIGYFALRVGWWWGDAAAAITVGAMIVMVGVTVFNSVLAEFAEKAVDKTIIAEIEQIVGSNKDIHEFHKLRTRAVGREVFVDLHILVEPGLRVAEGHSIAEDLTEELIEHLSVPANIMVHVEPDTEEIRKASVEK